jgi:hypothetical protein
LATIEQVPSALGVLASGKADFELTLGVEILHSCYRIWSSLRPAGATCYRCDSKKGSTEMPETEMAVNEHDAYKKTMMAGYAAMTHLLEEVLKPKNVSLTSMYAQAFQAIASGLAQLERPVNF